ncbi:Ig-like domain-containing protein [Paraglaciecola aquimarina]|uniref:Ig-like domain-containing protein n=1 Tax=Paraglaciecola aquimarina TaxID=1235557 RepID=A0ABU3SXP0_9ALTE|nr:Ig-like domain-containing protein [Paraglaciecola aquimarina]MDU0354770.1 Ig-like domain-containing protein [Paraglaciecola aquimarina]
MKLTMHKGGLLLSSLALIFTGCNDVDEGRSFGLTGEQPVTFTSDLSKAIDETEATSEVELDFNRASIDLMEGVDLNGSEAGYVRQLNYLEELTAEDAPEVNRGFFYQEDNALVINTDRFARNLSFGESATYHFSYIIDNGAPLPIDEATGEVKTRMVSVTINGIYDSVTEMNLSVGENMKLPPNEKIKVQVVLAPLWATDQAVTFSIPEADSGIATVNDQGEVSGVALGTTTLTITSVGNPELARTVNVEVTDTFDSPFSIDITQNEIVLPDAISIPECNTADFGANLKPLENNFTDNVEWSSTNEAVLPIDVHGVINTTQGSASGGAIAITATTTADVKDTVRVFIRPNQVCANAVRWQQHFDSQFESNVNNNWKKEGQIDTLDFTTNGDGITGEALRATVAGEGWSMFRFLEWSGDYNVFSQKYGQGDASSIGRRFTVSVWAKVVTRSNGEPITIEHFLTPWGVNGASSFPTSRESAAEFTATVPVNDNQWQLIEFTVKQPDDINQPTIFTVPTSWDLTPENTEDTQVFTIIPEFRLVNTQATDEILFDNYSIVEVN